MIMRQNGLLKFVMFFIATTCYILFANTHALADESPVTVAFQQGLKEYKSKAFDKAELSFQSAFDKARSGQVDASADGAVNQDVILTNLALAQYQQQKIGLALSSLRKALNSNPNNETAKTSLEWIWAKVPVKEIPHQIDGYEVFRSNLLTPVSVFFTRLFFAVCLFAFCWQILNFLGARKRAKAEQMPEPIPEFRHLFMLLATLLSALLFFGKIYDSHLVRGTIIEAKVQANIAPGDDQVALFELYEGFEVLVETTKGDQVQVHYPGGATGWINKKSISIDSDFGAET